MEIILAKSAGFCMGVKRAVNIALKFVNSENKIFTFGPLIHNNQLVDKLKQKGIQVANSIEEILKIKCKNKLVIIRAHGMPKDLKAKLKLNNIKLINATCPHVLSTQKKIEEYHKNGYYIIIVGDKKHPEILSLQSYSKNNNIVVSCLKDIENVPYKKKAIIIAQTTFNEKEYFKYVKILRSKAENCIVFNSICKATHNRQKELLELAKKVDAIIVVGGKHSANTRRLYELARKEKQDVFHIETEAELEFQTLKNYKKIGITAGASTPHFIIENIMEKLRKFQERSKY